VKKTEQGKGKLALAPRPSQKHDELDAARRGIYDAISMLQTMIEDVASEAFILFDDQRTLSAKHRGSSLGLRGSSARPGYFEEQQCRVLEGAEQLRALLIDIVDLSERKETLSFMMTLRDCGEKSEDLDRLRQKGEEPFSIAAQAMFAWGKLLRLCDLGDLSAPALSQDSPDLVAAAAALTVPTEDRITQIVAAGTTCVALLKEFCGYRGIETR
jgi:hypothetical protein